MIIIILIIIHNDHCNTDDDNRMIIDHDDDRLTELMLKISMMQVWATQDFGQSFPHQQQQQQQQQWPQVGVLPQLLLDCRAANTTLLKLQSLTQVSVDDHLSSI